MSISVREILCKDMILCGQEVEDMKGYPIVYVLVFVEGEEPKEKREKFLIRS